MMVLPRVRTMANANGSVYYYFGNIFMPLELHGSEIGRVKGAVRRFLKDNAQLVQKDRAEPDYRTLPQLLDVEPYNEVPGDRAPEA